MPCKKLTKEEFNDPNRTGPGYSTEQECIQKSCCVNALCGFVRLRMETDDGLLNGYSMTFEILDRFTNEIIHAQTITSGQGEYVDFGCHEIVGNQFNLRYTLNSPWVCGSKIISTIINEFGISINQCDPNTGIAPLYFGARWYCIGLGGGRGPEGPDLNPRP